MIKFTIFLILLVLGSFRSTEAQTTDPPSAADPTDATTQPPLTAPDPCANFTSKDECCKAGDEKSCLFCVEGEKPGVCSSSTCTAPAEDTCDPPPADPCANFTSKDECCKAGDEKSCLFCVEGENPGVCSSSACTAPAEDTCGAAPPVVGCATYTDVDTCCSAESCIFCQNETIPQDGKCSNETCTDGFVDKCAAPSPTEPPVPPGTTNSSETTTTTPSSSDKGGSGGQKFDGPSFIGGIVLCGGLVAILFFGLKFYKARKEQNYHTL